MRIYVVMAIDDEHDRPYAERAFKTETEALDFADDLWEAKQKREINYDGWVEPVRLVLK